MACGACGKSRKGTATVRSNRRKRVTAAAGTTTRASEYLATLKTLQGKKQ